MASGSPQPRGTPPGTPTQTPGRSYGSATSQGSPHSSPGSSLHINTTSQGGVSDQRRRAPSHYSTLSTTTSEGSPHNPRNTGGSQNSSQQFEGRCGQLLPLYYRNGLPRDFVRGEPNQLFRNVYAVIKSRRVMMVSIWFAIDLCSVLTHFFLCGSSVCDWGAPHESPYCVMIPAMQWAITLCFMCLGTCVEGIIPLFFRFLCIWRSCCCRRYPHLRRLPSRLDLHMAEYDGCLQKISMRNPSIIGIVQLLVCVFLFVAPIFAFLPDMYKHQFWMTLALFILKCRASLGATFTKRRSRCKGCCSPETQTAAATPSLQTDQANVPLLSPSLQTDQVNVPFLSPSPEGESPIDGLSKIATRCYWLRAIFRWVSWAIVRFGLGLETPKIEDFQRFVRRNGNGQPNELSVREFRRKRDCTYVCSCTFAVLVLVATVAAIPSVWLFDPGVLYGVITQSCPKNDTLIS